MAENLVKDQLYFFFDQTRCMGCQTCVVACKDWQELKPGRAKLRNLHDKEAGSWPKMQTFISVYSCNHCDSPKCMSACPTEAIFKDEKTGIVYVDENICQGVGDCIAACPYNAPQIPDDFQEPKNPNIIEDSIMEGHIMRKCDMCWDRVTSGEGLKPACVASCLSRALDWGTYDDLIAKYPDAKSARDTVLMAYNDENTVSKMETKPNFLFRAKPKKF